MTVRPSDVCLIGLLFTLMLAAVAGNCATGEIGFLAWAVVFGGCLVGAIDIATLFWTPRLDPLVRSAGARRTWLRCLIRSDR